MTASDEDMIRRGDAFISQREADTITALRTKLAAANARADRAEAERAAQIEEACAVIDAHAEYDQAFCCDGRECGCQGVSVHDTMKHFIRQPHDRTALDRMLAKARERALREAAEMVRGTAYTSSNVGRRLEPVSPAMAGMDMHHATIADAILAMIEKPDAT